MQILQNSIYKLQDNEQKLEQQLHDMSTANDVSIDLLLVLKGVFNLIFWTHGIILTLSI